MVFYLIYISSATKLLSDNELMQLLEESRANNQKQGITGMLLYKGGNFLQMIEGEKESVLKLFDSIKKDKRHKDVITLLTPESEKRSFESWSMGFCNMERIDGQSKYRDYIDEQLLLRDFQDDAQSAYKLLVGFDDRNY